MSRMCMRSGGRLHFALPPWIRGECKKDNWQGSPWDSVIQAQALQHPGRPVDDHF